jgi:hypothetical protein
MKAPWGAWGDKEYTEHREDCVFVRARQLAARLPPG